MFENLFDEAFQIIKMAGFLICDNALTFLEKFS